MAKTAVPIDGGAIWSGREIFGKNKTWRGLIVGVATGVLVAGMQKVLFLGSHFFASHTLVDYREVNFVLFGAAMGGGGLIGDLIESFVKRRLNKPSGKPWFPWDQADWIIGAILMSAIIYVPSLKVVAVTLVLYVGIHLCSDRIVCKLGIKTREEVN